MPEHARREEFDECSKHAFQTMKFLADGISKTFGSSCEVVIHDFADLEHSVVYVAGSVTKRSIGAPLTNLVLGALRVYGEEVPDLIGYRAATRDGREIKSSTIFIRDSSGRPIGCLCINLDLTGFRAGQLALNDLLVTVDPSSTGCIGSEEFADNVSTLARSLLERALERLDKSPGDLSREERLELISELEEKGLFLVKGSIEEVAGLINTSKHTVYRYLDQIRESRT
ncbi:MAG: helix-turn-helix transcriptional regulator [Bacillota bacterium]|jgi:predicted transcriptional regulator YheO